jgi:chemotaxis protein CheD
MQHTVNISDAKVSKNATDVIVTYSLGSCIGVMLYDPHIPVAGMLHFQLPTATMDPERAKKQPHLFGDSGLDSLLNMMLANGASKKRIKVKLAGGAKMFEGSESFDIGKRNHQSIRKALWQHGLFIDKEDVGGAAPRTVNLNVADGAITIKSGGSSKAL